MKFDTLYSPIELNKNRNHLRRFWEGKLKTVFSSYPSEYEYRQIENLDKMAETAVLNLAAGRGMPGTNIPRLAIDFGTVSTASYWGGRIYRPSAGRVWIDPIIHCASDVWNIKAGDPKKGDNLKALQIYEMVCEKLDANSLPATPFDLQGPLNTLSLMWDQQDFMMAMYDEPDSVHKALEMVTAHLIGIIDAAYRLNPAIEAPLWPYIWLPSDIGIGMTEDYMPLLSPDLYKEFGIPYVERLSRQFKGLFIHCCGQFSHHIENLYNSKINILGMEFVYPNIDIEKLFGIFGASTAFVPNIMDKSIEEFGSMTEYFRFIHRLRKSGTRLWFILRPDLDDFNEQVEFLESIADEI